MIGRLLADHWQYIVASESIDFLKSFRIYGGSSKALSNLSLFFYRNLGTVFRRTWVWGRGHVFEHSSFQNIKLKPAQQIKTTNCNNRNYTLSNYKFLNFKFLNFRIPNFPNLEIKFRYTYLPALSEFQNLRYEK